MTDRPKSRQAMPEDAKKVFSGILFDVYQWEQPLFDGSTATFEKLKRNDSCVVVPILPNGNFLIAEDEQPGRETVLTFPGGQGELNEDPETSAKRELLEETGYEPGELVLWKSQQPSSKIDWAIYTYIARNCKKVTEPKLDPGERITLREVSFEEVLMLADDPRFQNREMVIDLLKARYDEEARTALKAQLLG